MSLTPRKPVAPGRKTPLKPVPKKPLRPRALLTLRMPRGPLFVGSWHRLSYRLAGTLKPDGVEFVVVEGPKAGLISPSRERGFDAKRPSVMLLVGPTPGRFTLEARRVGTGTRLWQGSFEVTALWPDDAKGPSQWFTGEGAAPYAAGAAWGGGAAGPQNVNVIPATGTRRIALLLVDTSDQRFDTAAGVQQGHRDRWINEVINGVTQGGVTRSVRTLYREMSLNRFDISGQVFGPVQLPGAWDDYFNSDGSFKVGFMQACVTAGDGLIDYTQFDTLAAISQRVDGPPVRSAWPYAWGGTFTSAEGNRALGFISMPNEWGTTDAREIFDTFSHELGHNLGLGDQYTPAVAGRNPGSWELMAWDDPLPHVSLAHKAMLGWLDAGWIRSFDFKALGGNVDVAVDLSPIAAGAPAAGRFAGIEVRIADGWNYYFEYRRGQAAQIGDRALPEDGVVLGTDVVSAPYTPPFSRPAILLLPADTTPTGEALALGEDYRETDFTDPTYPADFRVEVTALDASRASLRVRYGVLGKPDPSIRPWPASPDRPWQSPDIEVRNARNAADPAWANVPWIGNANTIVARVRNNGQLDAPQVRVNFYVKNYNVGGTPESFLASDVRDVAAGATVEFTCPWVPPSGGHYCVVVRIPLYSTPATPPAIPVVEQTELNNLAQSNYDRFISATSVPSREVTRIEVGNPYAARTRVYLWPGQTNPAYRTYLECAWMELDPGETRSVAMMFELAPDNLSNGLTPQKQLGRVREGLKRPNAVGCTAWVEDPFDAPRHKVDLLGGVQVQVVTGFSTKFVRFSAGGPRAVGAVETVESGQPAQGQVLLRVERGTAKKPEWEYVKGKLNQGNFVIPFQEKGVRRLKAFYLPAQGYAECESGEIAYGVKGRARRD